MAKTRGVVVRGMSFAMRGRFVRADRAVVVVRRYDPRCRGRERYVVRHVARRTAVRNGRFVSFVGSGAARVFFRVSAFGRMVQVEFLEGSLSATCSDGSQHLLPVVAPEDVTLAGPVRPSGRFRLSGGPGMRIFGSFDGGVVGAWVDVRSVLPDGVSCRAFGTLVGALAFPEPATSSEAVFP